MKLWTLEELMNEILEELGLHGQSDATHSLIKAKINEAIEEAEELIMDNHMDFFLTSQLYNVNGGEEELDLPSDIYMARIRYFQFYDGNRRYQIKKIPLDRIATVRDEDDYQYRLEHSSEGISLKIYPPIRDASEDQLKVWYIREANRLEEMTDKCDLPHAKNFIMNRVKLSLLPLFPNPALYQRETAKEDALKMKLIEKTQVLASDGEDNFIPPDFSHYNDSEDIYL